MKNKTIHLHFDDGESSIFNFGAEKLRRESCEVVITNSSSLNDFFHLKHTCVHKENVRHLFEKLRMIFSLYFKKENS